MYHVWDPVKGIPVKMWVDDMDEQTETQAYNLAHLPFAYHHIAIMPDAHLGYGMPIGGVLAADGVVIPNAVGVDIGCGVLAAKTSLTELSVEDIKRILGGIRASIPVGFNKHSKEQNESLMPDYAPVASVKGNIVGDQYPNALKSLGTLGGNNHFIEIQKGSDGHIWIMIHSGSRNLGKQVADHYRKVAINLNAKWHTSVDPKWDLAFLPLDSDEGQAYTAEMRYCVGFAKASRSLMLERVQKAIFAGMPDAFDNCFILENIYDIAHNYAVQEHHFGKNVWVHRKGATRAREGEIGIIPGTQGTASYIVRGKGNPESFMSCSHGGGRKMSKKQARKELDFDKEVESMAGILHSVRGKSDLAEAPGAYKDITEVMANQTDLVEITVSLKPLATVKG
jgi:tRNA-splicing ligase RtcB